MWDIASRLLVVTRLMLNIIEGAVSKVPKHYVYALLKEFIRKPPERQAIELMVEGYLFIFHTNGGLMAKTLALSVGRSGVRIPGRGKCSLRTTAIDMRVNYPLYLFSSFRVE